MLIGIYTDKNGNRWETYKSDNPKDVLGPFSLLSKLSGIEERE